MKAHRLVRAGLPGLVLAFASTGLSGCFDLSQRVAIGRDGSGRYDIAASGQGVVGQALRNEKIVDTAHKDADLVTTVCDGMTIRRASIAFQSLSDLFLADETMSLSVKRRDLLGLGPAHAAIRCEFPVGSARRARSANANGIGEQIARSVLGDHFYSFAVTVPGSVEYAAPVVAGGETYQPAVTGDFYRGRTVLWRIPLYALVDTQLLDFAADFAAFGSFVDAQTRPGASE